MAHILIIEDDEDLRPLMASILSDDGNDVTEAAEGGAALEKTSANAPDLVITDLVMQGMEGIASILALRERSAGVPILAISGNALYLANSEKLGADASLLKPFTREDLLDTVHALLAGGAPPGQRPVQ